MTTEKKVASVHAGAQIDIRGFECLDPSLHMIEWLGRGRDVSQFVANDMEGELYGQDAGGQLLSIEFVGEPQFETKVKREGASQQGVVSQFAATFPLQIRVKASNGATWVLTVQHNYRAVDLDVPGQQKLTLNFQIVGQQQLTA